MKLRIVTTLAVCVAFACVAVAPSAASAGEVEPDCTSCIRYIENPEGADVHSSPGGPVIGWVEWGTEVYVISSPEGVWCNVRFEDGPNKGNGGWILCGDL
jgi:hypothetical protein